MQCDQKKRRPAAEVQTKTPVTPVVIRGKKRKLIPFSILPSNG